MNERMRQGGHAIVEEYIQSDYDRIRNHVISFVEPFVESLPSRPDNSFELLARSLIKGFDSIKADRLQPLEVAFRTFEVARMIGAMALPHTPTLELAAVIDKHLHSAIPIGRQYASLFTDAHQAFQANSAFRGLMTECSRSIDPSAEEPDMIPLFAGFTLLAMESGEVTRAQNEIEAAASILADHDGDLWALFDDQK